MPRLEQSKILPFKAIDLFNLVLDVENYPKFLSWVDKVTILKKEHNQLIAQVDVKYSLLSQTYICKVDMIEPMDANGLWQIIVQDVSGPFDYLNNVWIFKENDLGQSQVDFMIDFEFKNSLLKNLMNNVFDYAATHMFDCFAKRAIEIIDPTKK